MRLGRLSLWALAILAITLQGKLWLTDDGFRKTRELRQAVAAQRRQNLGLRERNLALEAEVLNLKNGREAAEEKARTDLGLIGPGETFYQVVEASNAAAAE